MNASPMEEIFGKGSLETERKIPGTRPNEDSSVRYISFDNAGSISELFNTAVRKITPPLSKEGGVVLEGTRLKLPNGAQFFAVSFHGDIEGWQKQIQQGATELGRATARVLAGDFLTSDGQSYPLSSCEVEFH